MNSKVSTRFMLSLLLLPLFSNLSAATITIDASNSGSYNIYGSRLGAANPDPTKVTIVTWFNNYVSWLGFDLSALTDEIASARLEVESDPRNSSGQQIEWHDVTSPYGDLGTVNDVAISNDISSGVLFATGVHTGGIINSFDLNAAAISSLNAAAGFWAIGGSATSGNTPAFGYAGGVAGGEHLRLVIETADDNGGGRVPAPAPIFLIGLGLLAVTRIQRRPRGRGDGTATSRD